MIILELFHITAETKNGQNEWSGNFIVIALTDTYNQLDLVRQIAGATNIYSVRELNQQHATLQPISHLNCQPNGDDFFMLPPIPKMYLD